MASFFASLKSMFQSKSAEPLPATEATSGSAPQSAKVAAAPAPAPLGIPQLVATAGMFPINGGSGPAMFTLAMIQSFAGSTPAYGAPRASGQLVPVMSNQQLFSVIGNAYGGNAVQNFALPNLKGRVAAGGGMIGEVEQGTLSMTFVIAANGMAEAPAIGTIMAFAGNFAPEGWLVADGSTLAIEQNVALFKTIGNAFGGNGTTTFALPSLNPVLGEEIPLRVPLGVGAGPGRPPVTMGQIVPNSVGAAAGLGLNFLICVKGVYPTSGGNGEFPADEAYLGQVIAFAGSMVPQGWAVCDGALLPIQPNAALYTLLGTAYGGDGVNNFALPDLRGRAMAGV